MIRIFRTRELRLLSQFSAFRGFSTDVDVKQTTKITPIGMKIYIENWPRSVRLNKEQVCEAFPQLQRSQSKKLLITLEKDPSAARVFSILEFLLAQDYLNPMDAGLVFKLLSRAFIESPLSMEDREFCKNFEVFIPKDGPFSAGCRCIFNVLMDKWPLDLVDYGVMGQTCYLTLITEAMRRNDLEKAKEIVSFFKNLPYRLHEDFQVFEIFLERLKESGKPWLVPFLQQFEVSNVQMGDFKAFQRAAEVAKVPLTLSSVESGCCKVCGTSMQNVENDGQLFDELRKTLFEYLEKAVKQNHVGNLRDFNSMLGLIKAIQRDHKDKMPTRKCIVVDTLNFLNGLYVQRHPGTIDFLIGLKKEYEEVVLMMRKKVLSDDAPKLRGSGIRLVEVSRDSDDDTFAIMTALLINNNTFVASNDRFGLTRRIMEKLGNAKAREEFEDFVLKRAIGVDKDNLVLHPPLQVPLNVQFSEDGKQAHFVLIPKGKINEQRFFCIRMED